MVKIALIVFSLATALSTQIVAGQDAAAAATGPSLNEEQAFYLAVGIALDQMAEAGILDGEELKDELNKADFHKAYELAKTKENNGKAVFVASFLIAIEKMVNSGLLERSEYEKLFPGGGKTLTPELDLQLTKAYEEAKHFSEQDLDGEKPKHDL